MKWMWDKSEERIKWKRKEGDENTGCVGPSQATSNMFTHHHNTFYLNGMPREVLKSESSRVGNLSIPRAWDVGFHDHIARCGTCGGCAALLLDIKQQSSTSSSNVAMHFIPPLISPLILYPHPSPPHSSPPHSLH